MKKLKRMTGEDVVFTVVIYVLLLLIAVICVYPLIYVTSMSISDSVQIAAQPVLLLPRGFSLGAFEMLFADQNIWRHYGNTIFYTALGTFINVSLTILLAYPLSIKTFAGRKPITMFVTFTMLFSGGMIPSYMLVNSLGLYNTMWALILPTAISVFNTIIARTFFAALPESLAESAKIDGANDFTVLLRIILPVSKAVIATQIIYYAVAHWNSYLPALLYMSDSKLHPLQMFLVRILINNDPALLAGMETGVDRLFMGNQLKYSCIVIATLPILCVYPFFQKHFTQGVMMGSMKG